jgi:hypothetical protein
MVEITPEGSHNMKGVRKKANSRDSILKYGGLPSLLALPKCYQMSSLLKLWSEDT